MISKIIVARLRTLLGKLVSPNQVSFIPGRHISDNIMIAQEMLHKCRQSRGNKGFMIWKVDLSKAYEKLSWSFIGRVDIQVWPADSLLFKLSLLLFQLMQCKQLNSPSLFVRKLIT